MVTYMLITPINKESLALFIETVEIGSEFGPEMAKLLAKAAFNELGLRADGTMELEAYPGNTGVLLFARLVAEEVYRFEELDDLLAAVTEIPPPFPASKLTYYGGRYYLTVNGLFDALTEFAEHRSGSSLLAAFLAEHGRVLSSPEALSFLNEIFN